MEDRGERQRERELGFEYLNLCVWRDGLRLADVDDRDA
jgi:hypothetical protein